MGPTVRAVMVVSRISMQDALEAVRTQYRSILLVVLVAATTSLAISHSVAKRYQATASLAYSLPSDEYPLLGSLEATQELPYQRAFREAQIVLTPRVLARSRDLLTPRPPLETLQSEVSVRVQNLTNLILIRARAASADQAAAMANAVAQTASEGAGQAQHNVFATIAQVLRTHLQALPTTSVEATTARGLISALRAVASIGTPLKVAGAAIPPRVPLAPRPIRGAVLAATIGLAIGVILALLRFGMDPRPRSAEQIQSLMNVPLLARLGTVAPARPLAPVHGNELEPFRIALANLDGVASTKPSRIVVVTSPYPKRDHSRVTSLLALAAAAGGRRTLLIDGDLRDPTTDADFGISLSPGLTDILKGHATSGEALRSIPVPEFCLDSAPRDQGSALVCMPRGSHVEERLDLLASDRMRNVLRRCASRFELVIINTDAVGPSADTLELVALADLTILSVAVGHHSRDAIRGARRTIDTAGCLAAIVVSESSQLTAEPRSFWRRRFAPRSDMPWTEPAL